MRATVDRAIKFLDSTTGQTDTSNLKYCEYNKTDDWYLQFIKRFYFPFLLKYSRYICLLWLCVFVIAIIFGPEFLSLTRSDLEVPKGTPTALAIEAFIGNYPTTPTYVNTKLNSITYFIGDQLIVPFSS